MSRFYKELSNAQLVERAASVGATKPHFKVSDKYTFIPTLDAVNLLRDDGWVPIDVQETNARDHHIGYQKHMIRFTRPDLLGILDDSRTDLLMYNSHNRGSAYQLLGGIWKFICSNGLVVGKTLEGFRHMHMGFSDEEFINSAKTVSSNMVQIADTVRQWNTIEMSPDEQGFYAQRANRIAFGDESEINNEHLLWARRNADKKNDIWHVFNRVQENVVKGGLYAGRTATGRRRTTRQIKAIDRDKRVNQALWDLTDFMHEFKKAA